MDYDGFIGFVLYVAIYALVCTLGAIVAIIIKNIIAPNVDDTLIGFSVGFLWCYMMETVISAISRRKAAKALETQELSEIRK